MRSRSASLGLLLLLAPVLAQATPPTRPQGDRKLEAQVQKLAAADGPGRAAQAFLAKRFQVMGIRSFCRGREGLSSATVHPGTARAVLDALRIVYGSALADRALQQDAESNFARTHPQYRAPGSNHKAKARDLPPADAIFVDLAELPIQVLREVVLLSRKAPPGSPTAPIAQSSALYRELHGLNLNGHQVRALERGRAPTPIQAALDDLMGNRQKAVAAIARKWGLRSIKLFGSTTRRQEKPDSDFDFLVRLGPGQSYAVLDELRTALSRVTGRKVDVVPIEFFPPAWQGEIQQKAVPIWSDPRE